MSAMVWSCLESVVAARVQAYDASPAFSTMANAEYTRAGAKLSLAACSAMSSHHASSSSVTSSPSALFFHDNASGPLCLSAGTCTSVKSNKRIP